MTAFGDGRCEYGLAEHRADLKKISFSAVMGDFVAVAPPGSPGDVLGIDILGDRVGTTQYARLCTICASVHVSRGRRPTQQSRRPAETCYRYLLGVKWSCNRAE